MVCGMEEVCRVLVADDDPLVRQAYRAFFSQQPDFELCGEAHNGAQGVEAYGALQPDIMLMDLQMPVLTGVEAIRQICQRWPHACVVALTTFGTNEYIVSALRAGASGYLLKDVGGPGLLAGMRQALAGDMPLSGSVRRELVTSVLESRVNAPPPGVTFSEREVELLRWLAQGLTNQQIGTKMFVSEGSVKQYLSHIGDKLGVKSRTAILIRSIQLNVVDPHTLPPVVG